MVIQLIHYWVCAPIYCVFCGIYYFPNQMVCGFTFFSIHFEVFLVEIHLVI